jgi:hypothetical protein
MSIPLWLALARRLQAIAQSGLTYCQDKFDIQRYHEVRQIAAELMASGASLPDPAPLVDLFAQQSGYATPKIDLRVAAFRDGRILLVRELEDSCWTLPGGWADVGEAPSLAAAREVLEESGYVVRITSTSATQNSPHPSTELVRPYPACSCGFLFSCELICPTLSGVSGRR